MIVVMPDFAERASNSPTVSSQPRVRHTTSNLNSHTEVNGALLLRLHSLETSEGVNFDLDTLDLSQLAFPIRVSLVTLPKSTRAPLLLLSCRLPSFQRFQVALQRKIIPICTCLCQATSLQLPLKVSPSRKARAHKTPEKIPRSIHSLLHFRSSTRTNHKPL